jgi:hypothetical protein
VTLLEVFDRLEQSGLGSAVRDSSWLFPVIEAGHLLGLALLGGAVLILDLRLLGLGLTARPVDALLDDLHPWFLAALAVLIGSGVPLFLSEAVKCYWSDAFWLKMGALAGALAFTFGVRNRLARASADLPTWQGRALGATSMALWLTVAAAGRWIGFS